MGVKLTAAGNHDEPAKVLETVTAEDFIAATAGSYDDIDEEVLHWLLSEINVHSPNTLALAMRLMTTGNDEARSGAKEYIVDQIIDIACFYPSLEEVKSLDLLEPEEKFYQIVGVSQCKAIEFAMLKGWNYEEMRPELPEELCYFNQMLVASRNLHQMVVQFRTIAADSFCEDWYWRGLVAQSLLTDIRADNPSRLDIPDAEFIHWAGNHDDIGAVMRLAVEHRTTNIRFLGSLLEDGTVSPLFDGRL